MSTATNEITLPNYLNELGVKITSKQIDHPTNAPDWAHKSANAYRVSLTFNGKRTSLYFYQGKGIDREPTIADVVACLASDYACSRYSLQEFGDEFGWDSQTVSTYRAVTRSGMKLARLLGDVAIIDQINEIGY